MNVQIKDVVYVALQVLLFVLYVLDVEIFTFSDFPFISILGLVLCGIGVAVLVIAVLQLNTNLSPFPTPKAGSHLVTEGLYRYSRHPIYSGIILVTVGYAIHMSSSYKLLLSILMFIMFQFKARYEEDKLKMKFPAYEDYMKHVGRFFPKIK